MSLFAELKRRNVFKVAAAYLVLAWLVLQVTDVFLNNIDAPAWLFQVVTFFLVLGFVFAMFFAWAFELTPEGLKREKEVDRSQSITTQTGRKLDFLVIGLLVAALGYFAYDKFVLGAHRDAALVEATTQALSEQAMKAPVDETPSIAVLPFVNMSSDAEQEYFSDGLSEEMLNLLAKVPDLRVTSRSSAFFYKGKDIKIADVGRELNVANVLEGSVRKAGNTIRVTAQLIRVEDDVHLWSETYDRSLEDVFAIQDEIAAHVVEQLKVELLGEAPHSTETDPEAYALYLQGRAAARLATQAGYENAVDLYQQSLAIDPEYTPAWNSLVNVYTNQALGGLRNSKEGYDLALDATQKVLAIDPENAKAHASLGFLEMYWGGDLEAAARHYEQALQIEPGDLGILNQAAGLTMELQRLDLAAAITEFIVERDPTSGTMMYNLAQLYLSMGRYHEVIRLADRTLKLSPGRLGASSVKGAAQLMLGDEKAAHESMLQESGEYQRLQGLALTHHVLGEPKKAEEALRELIDKHGDDLPGEVAYVYAFKGESDKAFEWLDKEIEQYGSVWGGQLTHPLMSGLRDDPRWSGMLERIGRSKNLLDSIKFDIKLPTARQVAQATG